MVSKLYQNKQIGLSKNFIRAIRAVGWCSGGLLSSEVQVGA
jgi:hypothetical protein